jgi:hypothetical protein
LRAEGFSCSLDVLYEGLGIRKLPFLIFEQEIFFQFWSSKPWIRIRIGIQPKMLDPDPESMNPDPDPKHWLKISLANSHQKGHCQELFEEKYLLRASS